LRQKRFSQWRAKHVPGSFVARIPPISTNGDLCKTGVAASRQRAALFNLLQKCGGLPTAATMKGSFSEVSNGFAGNSIRDNPCHSRLKFHALAHSEDGTIAWSAELQFGTFRPSRQQRRSNSCHSGFGFLSEPGFRSSAFSGLFRGRAVSIALPSSHCFAETSRRAKGMRTMDEDD
jgi:hypothetical protein